MDTNVTYTEARDALVGHARVDRERDAVLGFYEEHIWEGMTPCDAFTASVVDMIKWIDSLSEEERNQLEQEIQIAQEFMNDEEALRRLLAGVPEQLHEGMISGYWICRNKHGLDPKDALEQTMNAAAVAVLLALMM